MTGETAERFVVLSLRAMAIGFAITGFFFIAGPDGTLARITELGHHFGFHTPAPKTDERLWLSLGFAYMVVITFLAWIASTDVVRYRPLVILSAIGEHVAEWFVEAKRQEWDTYRIQVTPWETERYLELF